MAEWNEHVLKVTAEMTKRSKQAMENAVRDAFTAGTHVDFKNPENLKSLRELARIMEQMFRTAGNTKIDFSQMITMPGPELFDGLKEAAKEFGSVWGNIIEKMGSHNLKNIFMRDQSDLSMALSRLTDKDGKLVRGRLKNIENAFKDIKQTDINKLLNEAMGLKTTHKNAESWEEQTAAALRYLKVYEKISNLNQSGKFDEMDIEPHLMPTFKNISKLGSYAVDTLRDIVPQMQTSLQNIFNLASGKPLIGLTEGGRIDLEVVPTVIKTLDVGDVLGGKTSIEVPVVFKAKLDLMRELSEEGDFDQLEKLQDEIASMFPEDVQRAVLERLENFAQLEKVTSRNYQAIWKSFVGYGMPTGGVGGFGIGDGSGTGAGDGAGSGGESRTEEDVENARKIAEYEARARAEAEAKEKADKRRNELAEQLELYDDDESTYNLEESESQKAALQEILNTLKQENLLTDELQAKYDSINLKIDERISLLKSVRQAYDSLETADNIDYNMYDADEAQQALNKRKEIINAIPQNVIDNDADIAGWVEEIQQGNLELEKRIGLLQQVKQGLIDIDSVDDIMSESGDLDSKLSRLQDVASTWGSDVKDADVDEDDDALEALQEFEETYDRIVLKLANGRNIEILPNAKGLRALHKYDNGIDSGAYGETEIEDIEFVRKEIQQIQPVSQQAQSSLESLYEGGSDAAKKAIQDLAIANNKLKEFNKMVATNPEPRNQAIPLSEEEKARFLNVAKEYQNTIKQINDLEIVAETEDDKQRLIDLKTEAIKLHKVLRQAYAVDGNIHSYIKDYGLSYEEAEKFYSSIQDSTPEKFIEQIRQEYQASYDDSFDRMEQLNPEFRQQMFKDYDQLWALMDKLAAAHEELNRVESQNPPAQDDTDIIEAETESVEKKIKSYEELSAAVSRYVELAKTLVDTEKMTPEHQQILRDMESVDTYGMRYENYIEEINKQQKNISKIKSAIKAGASLYTDEDGYENDIVEDTLAEAEGKLRGYIYHYAENFGDIGDLVDGAKTKGLKNIINKEVDKFKADEEIQRQQEEIAEAANAAAIAEMEQIEEIILGSAPKEKYFKAFDHLQSLRYHAQDVDRFTQSAQTDYLADDLGIATPHQEIRNNAQAIKSYEELCGVVERYLELQKKRIIFSGDESRTLTEDEENEFEELIGRLNATRDGIQITYREVEGDINKLAQLLGITVPQAAQQAQQAVGGLNNELTETGGKVDNIGEQAEGSIPGAGAGQTDGATSDEVKNLNNVRDAVARITAEVKEKTQEFLNEQSAVKKVSDSEVHALGEVEKKVTAIRVALSNVNTLLNNIKNGKDIGAGLSNITINVNHKEDKNDASQMVEVVKQAVASISKGNKSSGSNEKAPWARDDTLRSLTNKKIENIVNNTKKIKIDKDGLATNDVLNRVAQAMESIAARAKSTQTQTLDPTSIINPIIAVIQNVCAALSRAELAVSEFGNKVGLFNQQNLIVATTQNGNNKAPANTQARNNGNRDHLYSVKTLEIFGADKAVVDTKTLEVEKSKTSDAIVTTSTLKDEKGAVERRITETSYGRFEAEKVKEESKAIKGLIKAYEHLGELRAKRDMLPKGAQRDELQKEIKLETSRLWKQAQRLGVDSEKTNEASALGEHNVQMNQLIAKTKLLGKYEADIVSMDKNSESYNNAKKRINELNSEIALIQKKITLTQEEKFELDELIKKNVELANKKSSKQTDKKTKTENTERAKEIEGLAAKYKKLGELRAKFEGSGDLEDKEELRILAEQVKQKRESLALTTDEVLALRKKSDEAYKTEKRLVNAAKEQKSLDAQRKAADKAAKKTAADQKKLDKRRAMAGKASGAISRAEGIWLEAEGLEQAKLPESFKKQVSEYYDALDQLRVKHHEVNTSEVVTEEQQAELIEQTKEVNKLTEAIGPLVAEYQKLSGANVDETKTQATTLTNKSPLADYEAQLKQYAKSITDGKAQIKSFNAETKTLTYTVKTGKNEFTEYTAAVRHLDHQMVAVQGTTKRAETFFEATARKMKELTSYFSGMAVFNRIGQELRRGIQYVREIDDALVELRKVTDETEETYDKFLRTAAKTGSVIGATISEVTAATATFSKLGYDMEMATEMAESAIVYKNVGDNIASAEDAADSIISTLKGFRIEASESMRIVDRFNEVGKQDCPDYVAICSRVVA